MERAGIITFMANPMTLNGKAVAKGNKAPDFTVLDNGMAPKSLKDYAGKKIIISVVPSLDTGVCDTQTRRFNQEAASLKDTVILTISCDLPFAQARWCGAAGIDKVITLSDHKELSFGLAYGVVIKELRLLTRAIFVIDSKSMVQYEEIVPEVTKEVNFTAALDAAKAAS